MTNIILRKGVIFMKNFAEKIKTFFVSHKIVSIASASVLAVAIIAGVSVGVMMNKNNKIDTKDGSSFEATGSFTSKGDKKDSKDNKDSSKTASSSSESTSSATSSVASPDAVQTESKASDPAYTQTPAGTKQSNNKGTATSGNKGNKGTTTNKTPAASSSSTPSTAPSQPSAPATPSQPSGGSTGGSTTVNPNTTSSDISAGTQMGQAIASGIDTSGIPRDEQGRRICSYCGRPQGNGENGTCMRVIVRLDENFNEVRECRHYS